MAATKTKSEDFVKQRKQLLAALERKQAAAQAEVDQREASARAATQARAEHPYAMLIRQEQEAVRAHGAAVIDYDNAGNAERQLLRDGLTPSMLDAISRFRAELQGRLERVLVQAGTAASAAMAAANGVQAARRRDDKHAIAQASEACRQEQAVVNRCERLRVALTEALRHIGELDLVADPQAEMAAIRQRLAAVESEGDHACVA
jgi:hypothetical protein